MTCIAGLVHEGAVYIGGDSCGLGGTRMVIRKDTKVFERGGMVFGFTSSFRMGQLLAHSLNVPEQRSSQSVEQFMATDFINTIRDCLKAGGFSATKEGVETGGTFLVGYRGRLFEIEDDYQVGERHCGFAAVGCGSDIALGALSVLPEKMPPRERVVKALEAAEMHSAGVRRPFNVVVLAAEPLHRERRLGVVKGDERERSAEP